MGFNEVDPKKGDVRQGVEPFGEAVSADAAAFLFNQRLFGLKYSIRALFAIAFPILTILAVYNLWEGRLMVAVLVCCMDGLLLWSYFLMRKYSDKSIDPAKQYWSYQNVIRGFLLIFFIFISYSVGWKSELDRVQWSYIFPVAAFICLGKREGFCWVVFFLASMVLILFYPRPEALSPDAFLGFKLRYLISFSIMCAVAFAGKSGIEATYARLIHRQGQLAKSEKQCREAYDGLQRETEERRQFQQALAESEGLYRMIADNVSDIIWTTDLNYRFNYVSPSVMKVRGFTVEEALSQRLEEMLTPESLQTVFQAMAAEDERLQRHPEYRDVKVTIELEQYRKDGSTIWTENEINYLFDQNRQPIGIIGVTREISKRKQAEIRLARLNDCFLQFGVSPDDNINRLVAVCGELMNATCALYNRLGKNLLCSVGQWQPPAGFKSEDKPNGHICYDVIQHGGEHPLLVRNLQESPYARTDPNILPYGLQTYLGMVVKWKQAAVGSLCVVYQTDITPSNDDLQFMTIIASAIAVEEDRLRTEEALRRAEENFRRSIDDSPLGVRIVTEEGETIYANRAILDIFGYDSIEELRTTPLKERYTPESYAEFQMRREKRKRGDYSPSEYEVSIVKKDGEVRQLKVFRKKILWDGEGQSQVIYIDITDLKQAEEELKKNENLLQKIFDVLPVGLWFADKDGKLMRGNPAGVKIWGAEPKVSLSGLGIFKARRLPSGEEIEPGDWALAHTMRENITVVDEMLEIDAFDGKKKVILNYTAPVLDDQGAIQGAIVVNLDITERRQAEEDLLASREQMRALAGRLQAVREEERTQIAREIHDELGGALTGLKIDFSLLTRAALKIKNETVRTSLLAGMDSMNESVDSTIQTVRRIAMELRPGVLDDLGLVAALEWQLKDFEKRTGIRCEFFPPVEDINFDADLSTALFRIFQEALTNVARHSGATEVRVRLLADADSTTLEVEDNGKGIGKKKALGSKSLGLLGMRERAQMFGGRITVTGTPGIGTTVTVQIPSVETREKDRDQGEDAG